MTRTALPSPRGTNYERLYLANSLAHDAAIDPDRARNAVDRRRGRARDEGEPDDDLSEIVSELQGLFQSRAGRRRCDARRSAYSSNFLVFAAAARRKMTRLATTRNTSKI